WYWTWPPQAPPRRSSPGTERRFRLAAGAAALAALGIGCYNFYAACLAWSGIRDYSRKNYSGAEEYWQRYSALQSDPYTLYRAGNNAWFRLRRPDRALAYYSQLRDTGNEDYANSNGIIGQILLVAGNAAGSLPFLCRETELFPLSVNAWYYRSRAELQLGRRNEAAASQQKMRDALQQKHLSLEQLPLLLGNPDYDLNHYLLPAPAVTPREQRHERLSDVSD
ncbi:MAG: tetratricopeptide repeat protein, partial [Victivallales bacterium]|nr:tetratricopeptide repeat protein [Victivallales bacterium]